ncbi:MAG TPA: imidazole glycerol phosphate synthase subunit HisF [Vicinamibacterales bacterium]|nr:imidazole glycerol phosphate synthase subunit HisF [Vicinamibacterales bacterium]
MLTRRLIACLDVSHGHVMKGVNFVDLKHAGDPVELARRYNDEGIDELVVLDISATLEGRLAFVDTVAAIARELFIPLTVGGGIRSIDDARAVIEAGADKVSINSAALQNPSLITEIAGRYGSQAVVVAIDTHHTAAGAEVVSRAGTAPTRLDPVTWAREAEARGAGEILLTSIDRDGTRSGFDCEITAAVSRAVRIPVIASGGAGSYDHFEEVFTAGCADAALGASVFHFQDHSVPDLKRWLSSRDIGVRPHWNFSKVV